ncbi:MAG: hypothetical protein RR359_03180 [Bacilli bacterium]
MKLDNIKKNGTLIVLYAYLFLVSFVYVFENNNTDYFEKLLNILFNPVFLLIIIIPSFIAYAYLELEKLCNNKQIIIRFSNYKNTFFNLIKKILGKQVILYIDFILILFIANNIGTNNSFNFINFLLLIFQFFRIFLYIATLTIFVIFIYLRYGKNISIISSFIIMLITYFICSNYFIIEYIFPARHLYFQEPNIIKDIFYYLIILILEFFIINKNYKEINFDEY